MGLYIHDEPAVTLNKKQQNSIDIVEEMHERGAVLESFFGMPLPQEEEHLDDEDDDFEDEDFEDEDEDEE